MKTAFATVIYKQARPFLEDFLQSVDAQTDKAFDLLLINDNYSESELAEIQTYLKNLTINYKIIDVSQQHLSIAGTRIEMLRCAKDLGYELVILGDADDTFIAERVEKYKEAFEQNTDAAFFYNMLVLEDGTDVFVTIPKTVEDIKALSQYNFVGLTSSAIRMEKLSLDFIDSLKECDSSVFDWYLFSRIVIDAGKGVYVKDAVSIYRIFENNMVGVSRDIQKEYEVKLSHYANLAKRYTYFETLQKKLKSIDIDKINCNKNHQGYWWSDIQMEE